MTNDLLVDQLVEDGEVPASITSSTTRRKISLFSVLMISPPCRALSFSLPLLARAAQLRVEVLEHTGRVCLPDPGVQGVLTGLAAERSPNSAGRSSPVEKYSAATSLRPSSVAMPPAAHACLHRVEERSHARDNGDDRVYAKAAANAELPAVTTSDGFRTGRLRKAGARGR